MWPALSGNINENKIPFLKKVLEIDIIMQLIIVLLQPITEFFGIIMWSLLPSINNNNNNKNCKFLIVVFILGLDASF